MERRDALKGFLAAPAVLPAAVEASRRGMPPVKITDVKVILTQPDGNHAVIVKLMTSEPGLYGLGCATHRERALAAATVIEQYMKPFVVGRNTDDIEDIWQSAYVQSCFRGGVKLNNALSGIDGALWDILGKRAGVPVYKLLGGKVRAAASPVFEPTPHVNNTIRMFEKLRATFGFNVEFLHDVHERVPPAHSLQLARALEPFRLFFLEDLFAPEDAAWFQVARQQTTTPLAMGGLFVNRNEWLPLVANRWIDFVRHHISAVGGLTMARKIAACCEFFNVRTAWHGPGNVSPVGHAVNLHLDLATYNFGIQEQHMFGPKTREVFPGAPEIRGGCMYSNDLAGLGVDLDEKAAAKFPYKTPGGSRGNDRRLDGTIVRP